MQGRWVERRVFRVKGHLQQTRVYEVIQQVLEPLCYAVGETTS